MSTAMVVSDTSPTPHSVMYTGAINGKVELVGIRAR